MTSTNKGSQVGGHRTEVDQQKLGPALIITAGGILGMRTIRWDATHSDGLANAERNKVSPMSRPSGAGRCREAR